MKMSVSSRATLDMTKYQLINWEAKQQFGNDFLKLESLTCTSWELVLVLLPPGICHHSSSGFTSVLLQTDQPPPAGPVGRRQPRAKSPCAFVLVLNPSPQVWQEADCLGSGFVLLGSAHPALGSELVHVPTALPAVKTRFCPSTKDIPR